MQRFYFDLYNTEHSQEDTEGQLFASRERAGMYGGAAHPA